MDWAVSELVSEIRKLNPRLSCEMFINVFFSFTRSLVSLLNFHFYSNANLRLSLRDCEWIQRNWLAPCRQLIIRELWSVLNLVEISYDSQRIMVDNWQKFFPLLNSDMLHLFWTIVVLSQTLWWEQKQLRKESSERGINPIIFMTSSLR